MKIRKKEGNYQCRREPEEYLTRNRVEIGEASSNFRAGVCFGLSGRTVPPLRKRGSERGCGLFLPCHVGGPLMEEVYEGENPVCEARNHPKEGGSGKGP